MERVRLPSTMITAVGYDSDDKMLEIRFRNGKTYRYFMVPERIFRDLTSATSAGEFFLQEIKSKFPFQEVIGS